MWNWGTYDTPLKINLIKEVIKSMFNRGPDDNNWKV